MAIDAAKANNSNQFLGHVSVKTQETVVDGSKYSVPVNQLASAVGNMEHIKKDDITISNQFSQVASEMDKLLKIIGSLFKAVENEHSHRAAPADEAQQNQKSNAPKFRI